MRVAWNVISVVDPIFTLPALILVVLTLVRRNRGYLLVGIGWMATYLTLGLVQEQRATQVERASRQMCSRVKNGGIKKEAKRRRGISQANDTKTREERGNL